jgi:hypothetical protein
MLCGHLFSPQEMGRKLEELPDCLLHAPVYTQRGRVSLRWRKNHPPRAEGFSSRDFPGPEASPPRLRRAGRGTGRENRDYSTGVLVVTKRGLLVLQPYFAWGE